MPKTPIKRTSLHKLLVGSVVSLLCHSAAYAQESPLDLGRFLSTGGVTTISGAGGGGIVPWATIGGYSTNDQVGGTAFATHVFLPKFDFTAYGGQFNFFDRVELSLARQSLSLGSTGSILDGKIINGLGLPPSTPVSALPHSLQFGDDYNINQDIIGVKVRLYGNIIYDQDSWIPQISAGYQYHHNENTSFLRTIGASPDGNEYYLAATKVWLDGLFGHYTMATTTLDFTNANQNGLLGFGGQGKNGYHIEPEFAVGWWATKSIVLGGEYRFMPHFQLVGYNALGDAFSKNNNWSDVYIAYFPTKYFSLTASYAMLGTLASEPGQNGLYISGTFSF